MEIPKLLAAPVRVGLAAADLGLAAAEQSAAMARDVVDMATDRLDPARVGGARRENVVTAAARVPFIVHRVADMLDENGPVDRVIRAGGPLDRATREGGILETLTAEDGVVDRIADMTEALNRLTPTVAAMNQRMADIEGVVGAANTMAEPVTDLLSSFPRFAMRTASEVARAAGQPPRRPRPAPRIVDSPPRVVEN